MILLRKKLPRFFIAYCITMVVLSAGLPTVFLASGVKTFTTIELFAAYDMFSVRDYVLTYTGTHMHMGVYFFGAILGFVLVRKNQFQFGNKVSNVLL